MQLAKKIWALMRPYHKQLIIIAVVTTIFEIVRMAGPYLFGQILNILSSSHGLINIKVALFIAAGLAGVRIFSLIIDYSTDILIERMLLSSHRHISTHAFSKLLELSLDYHEKVSTGKKISLLNRGADKLIDLIGAYCYEFQPIIIQLVVTIVLIFFTNWLIGLIFFLSMIPFGLITLNMLTATRKLRTKRHNAYEIQSGEIGDTVTNITVVKAFAQESRENTTFGSIWELIKNIQLKEYKHHMIVGFGRSMVVEIFYITLLCVGLFEVSKGALTVGGLVFLIILIERAYSNVYRLGRIYNRAIDAAEPVNRLTKLFNVKTTVINSPTALKVKNLQGAINFEDVSFSYGKKLVLTDVTFDIPAGSFTALVGKSGSGKSTIAKLMSRYYDPSKGSIVLDKSYNLKDIDLDTYRSQTAVVFQDSPVPNRQIWEVIAYSAGRTKYATVKDRVEKAAKLAYAHEFITELERGYHTLIGERGVKLSGGQRQRLAIARALFAEPRILIMDEPTSHLDTLSENLIQKALEDLSQQHSFTKIIIAHRLSTVHHANQILVMDQGRLVERGTHAELVGKGGVYSRIVAQSELKP